MAGRVARGVDVEDARPPPAAAPRAARLTRACLGLASCQLPRARACAQLYQGIITGIGYVDVQQSHNLPR